MEGDFGKGVERVLIASREKWGKIKFTPLNYRNRYCGKIQLKLI